MLGWRALFWIKLPLAAVVILVIMATCPREMKTPPNHRLDIAGLVASAGVAFFVLFGCTLGSEQGFSSPLAIGSLVATAVLAAVFVIAERQAHHPIIEAALLRLRDVDSALIVNAVMVFAFTGASVLITIYLQDVRGYSALEAGLLVLPTTATILGLIPLGTWLSRRYGAKTSTMVDMVVLGGGLFLIGQLTPTSAYFVLAAGLLVVGAGCGLLTGPVTHTAVTGPPPALAGTASGLFKMSSMLGGSLGVAVLIAIAHPGGTPEVEIAGVDVALRVTGVICLVTAAVVWALWPRRSATRSGDRSHLGLVCGP